MNKEKVIVSFSGGKDSTLSLYRMIKKGYKIIGLLVTFDNQNDSCFHKIPKDIFKKLSIELEIQLIEVDCSDGKIYEEEFERALKSSKDKGAEICVFGGPIFRQEVKFSKLSKEIVGDFGYLTIGN